MATLATDHPSKMEDRAFECTYHARCFLFLFLFSHLFPLLTTCPPPLLVHNPLLISLAIFLGMGRRPWATPEQLEFLKSYIPHLPHAKKTSGLQTLYAEVCDNFLKAWVPEPIVPKPGITTSPDALEAKAKERLLEVRTCFIDFPLANSCPISALPTGIKKNARSKSSLPFQAQNWHLVSSTYPGNRSAGSPLTNFTRRSPSFIGSQRIPHSVVRSMTSGPRGTNLLCTKSSSRSLKIPR